MMATVIGLAIAAVSSLLGVLGTVRDVRRREERFREALAQPGSKFIVTFERENGEIERHKIDPNDHQDVRTLVDLIDKAYSGMSGKVATPSRPA